MIPPAVLQDQLSREEESSTLTGRSVGDTEQQEQPSHLCHPQGQPRQTPWAAVNTGQPNTQAGPPLPKALPSPQRHRPSHLPSHWPSFQDMRQTCHISTARFRAVKRQGPAVQHGYSVRIRKEETRQPTPVTSLLNPLRVPGLPRELGLRKALLFDLWNSTLALTL